MKILFSGHVFRDDLAFISDGRDITATKIPRTWFQEDTAGYLQAIIVSDEGYVRLQFGRTPDIPEDESGRLELRPNIFARLCIHLKTRRDLIRCASPSQFVDNALLGNWSMRRKTGDPLEITLEI